jgi:hypothetical protein
LSVPKSEISFFENAINVFKAYNLTTFEVLTAILAALTLLVAYMAYKYTRPQGELAKEELKKKNEAKKKTKIDVFYRPDGHGRGILEICNTGDTEGKNVILWHDSVEPYSGYTNIGGAELCNSDDKKIKISAIHDKFPITLHHQNMDEMKFFWSWENPDGSRDDGEKIINL